MRLPARAFLASVGAPSDGVELGPDGAPIAFRIWKNGANATDMGVHKFTKRSAEELMASQAMRGNEFSIDVDHLSLSESAPPESRKAVGWMKLAVRPDGLWAVDVRWTAAVVAGLTADPPEWRYFSPAYNTDSKTNEIVQYLNTALTNNPRTWNVTALAAQSPQKGNGMKYEDCLAALMGDDEDKKTEAMAAMKAAFGEEKVAVGEKKEEKPAEAAAPPVAPKEEKKEETETAALVASLASTVHAMSKKLDEQASEKESAERASILAARPDLPKSLVATLQKMALPLMRETISAIPAATVTNKAAAQFVAGTRGDTQTADGTSTHRASQLPPKDRTELSQAMGREDETPKLPFWAAGGYRTYPQMNREQARQYASAKKITLPAPAPVLAPVAFAGGK